MKTIVQTVALVSIMCSKVCSLLGVLKSSSRLNNLLYGVLNDNAYNELWCFSLKVNVTI